MSGRAAGSPLARARVPQLLLARLRQPGRRVALPGAVRPAAPAGRRDPEYRALRLLSRARRRVHAARPRADRPRAHEFGAAGRDERRRRAQAVARLPRANPEAIRARARGLAFAVDLRELRYAGPARPGRLPLHAELVPRRPAGPLQDAQRQPLVDSVPAGAQRHPDDRRSADGRTRFRRPDRRPVRRDARPVAQPAAGDGNRAASVYRRPAVPAAAPAPRADAYRQGEARLADDTGRDLQIRRSAACDQPLIDAASSAACAFDGATITPAACRIAVWRESTWGSPSVPVTDATATFFVPRSPSTSTCAGFSCDP